MTLAMCWPIRPQCASAAPYLIAVAAGSFGYSDSNSGVSVPFPTYSLGSMVKKQKLAAAVRSTCSGTFK
ncbi:MAG: hypothetical protein WCS70_08430 [Verrucomicrobiota bacterium]